MFVLAGGETYRAGRDHGPSEVVAVTSGATATRAGYRARTINGDVVRVDDGQQSVVGPGAVKSDFTSDRAAGNAVSGGAYPDPPSSAQPPSSFAPQQWW